MSNIYRNYYVENNPQIHVSYLAGISIHFQDKLMGYPANQSCYRGPPL